jgi:hypothetical protein
VATLLALAVGLPSFQQRIQALARSPSPGLVRAGRLATTLAVPGMILLVLSPLLLRPWTLGQHDWEQMTTQREVVIQTIQRFHQLPFWDPFTCGGHPAWGSLESDPIVVSPWLPVYLRAPLPIAIRIEIIVSAIVGALGAWRLASRFTGSRAVQALFTVVTVVNSRWAMQIAAGHTWHLLYGLLPWILFLFDRAIDPATPRSRAVRDVAWAAGCLALMVYGDAIYPVPHTAFVLVVYAVVVARRTRRWRPITTLAALAGVAAGLSAPKLLPLFAYLQRFPRIIKSDEGIWPQYIPAMFTWRAGDYAANGEFVGGAMWHEWGLYLGLPALVGLVAGLVASRGPREHALKWAGYIMLSFALLGGVHPLTPWRLMHLLPLFKSQHVPARWLYPAVIVLACCAASGIEAWLKRIGARRAGVEAALGLAAVVLAIDLGTVARESIALSFVNRMPDIPEAVAPYRMVHRLAPLPGHTPGLWDLTTLTGVLNNVGTLECNTDNGLHSTHRDPEGRMPGVGAYGDNDPDYRGEAYVVEREASAAHVVSFTPNEVTVRVQGAQAGDHLVLNQNWDPGWTADGMPAAPLRDAVSTVVEGPSATVVFRYRPPGLGLGLAASALTVLGIGIVLVRTRERKGAPS